MEYKCIEIELPMPISVNKAFATVMNKKTGKPIRVKSNEYKDWIEIANLAYNKYDYEITGDEWLWVDIQLFFPLFFDNGKKRKKDVDNYIKTFVDFLTNRISWFEDHKIIRLSIEKFDSKNNIVKIKIYEL